MLQEVRTSTYSLPTAVSSIEVCVFERFNYVFHSSFSVLLLMERIAAVAGAAAAAGEDEKEKKKKEKAAAMFALAPFAKSLRGLFFASSSPSITKKEEAKKQ